MKWAIDETGIDEIRRNQNGINHVILRRQGTTTVLICVHAQADLCLNAFGKTRLSHHDTSQINQERLVKNKSKCILCYSKQFIHDSHENITPNGQR